MRGLKVTTWVTGTAETIEVTYQEDTRVVINFGEVDNPDQIVQVDMYLPSGLQTMEITQRELTVLAAALAAAGI